MSQVGFSMTPTADVPKPPKRKRGRAAVFIALLIVLALIAAAGYFAYVTFLKPAPDYAGNGTGTVIVRIAPGSGIPTIGDTLQSDDVVKSAEAFVDAASNDSRATNIQAGSYRMHHQMSAAAALDILTNPSNRAASVVIPEGARAAKVIVLASQGTGIPLAQFQAILKNPVNIGLPAYANNNAEGFLFPSSYDFGDGATAQSVLAAMVTKFNEVADKIHLASEAAADGRTPYDVVKVASILEAEGYEAYFPQIAQTIYNRLAINKPLELDSSINYGLGLSVPELTQSQLQQDTPYNLRYHRGLPQTPIGNPGEAALTAAVNPQAGKWIYFLSIPGTKTMRFAETYDEFLKYKAEMRAAQ